MSALLTATPAHVDQHMVTFGDRRKVGSFISCVYPPETTINARGWRVIRFKVVQALYPPFLGKKDDARVQTMTTMYQPIEERALTADEVAHFEALMFPQVQPRYVAIVGSRAWPYPQAVIDYVAKLPANTVVVSGGAKGVDTWAEQAARQRGLDVKVFPADWNTYGKSAGFRRNADIVNACDELTSFWDGVSRGTAHSVELARKAGKPVTVITPDMVNKEQAA